MFARALIVLLLVLNIGVAGWWITRTEPVADPVTPPFQQAARLQLLDEAAPTSGPVDAAAPSPAVAADADETNAVATPAPADASVAAVDGPSTAEAQAAEARAIEAQCYAFGPFADAAAVDRARALLQAQVQRLSTRETRSAPRGGWQVILRGLPDRTAATAMAERLKTAGFSDHYVMPSAGTASTSPASAAGASTAASATAASIHPGSVDIALGRFGSEIAARAHASALQKAGFQAQAEALGAAGIQHWIDVTATQAFDVVAARRASGAAQADRIDCSRLR